MLLPTTAVTRTAHTSAQNQISGGPEHMPNEASLSYCLRVCMCAVGPLNELSYIAIISFDQYRELSGKNNINSTLIRREIIKLIPDSFGHTKLALLFAKSLG